MAQILVRNLDPDVVDRLKRRAEKHGRSLQGEAKSILTSAAGLSFQQVRKLSAGWHKKLSGRKIPDITGLVRRDRER